MQIKNNLPSSCNIVKMLGHFQDSENAYLRLEYCPGGELFNLLKMMKLKGHLGLGLHLTRIYASYILLALQQIHSIGILFNDLKAENIVITKEGIAKITDFGLSKSKSCKDECRCPTLQISAPEVITKS